MTPDSRLIYVPGSLVWHWQMVVQMTRREITGRYRGSVMGLLWSFVTPLIMLAIYTFVFGYVFKSRWSEGATDRWSYALTLFAGLIVFNVLSECLNRAPTLILVNVNFVKKVVFPVEVLPWVALLASLFHGAISLLVLILVNAAVTGTVHWTILLVPLVLFPFVLTVIGLVWFLAALGVYLRDVGQTVGLFTSALMFASPIFYPITALPQHIQGLFKLNPLTIAVEEMRRVVLEGRPPNWYEWLSFCGVGFFVAWGGLAWFQKARIGFADVL